MVNVIKGGGHWACRRAPPTSPAQANFTLMTECTPESRRYYSVYSVDRTVSARFQNDVVLQNVACTCQHHLKNVAYNDLDSQVLRDKRRNNQFLCFLMLYKQYWLVLSSISGKLRVHRIKAYKKSSVCNSLISTFGPVLCLGIKSKNPFLVS
jgi:hypothetical protein